MNLTIANTEHLPYKKFMEKCFDRIASELGVDQLTVTPIDCGIFRVAGTNVVIQFEDVYRIDIQYIEVYQEIPF